MLNRLKVPLANKFRSPLWPVLCRRVTNLSKASTGRSARKTAPFPPPNQGAAITQGMLEGANVNATEELVASIDLQRTFEINLRMITNAKELDEAGTRLMRMPEA